MLHCAEELVTNMFSSGASLDHTDWERSIQVRVMFKRMDSIEASEDVVLLLTHCSDLY